MKLNEINDGDCLICKENYHYDDSNIIFIKGKSYRFFHRWDYHQFLECEFICGDDHIYIRNDLIKDIFYTKQEYRKKKLEKLYDE